VNDERKIMWKEVFAGKCEVLSQRWPRELTKITRTVIRIAESLGSNLNQSGNFAGLSLEGRTLK
jgi:hypothetical protein